MSKALPGVSLRLSLFDYYVVMLTLLMVCLCLPRKSGYVSYGAIAVTGTQPFNATAPVIAPEFEDSGRDLGALVAKKAATLKTLCI